MGPLTPIPRAGPLSSRFWTTTMNMKSERQTLAGMSKPLTKKLKQRKHISYSRMREVPRAPITKAQTTKKLFIAVRLGYLSRLRD